MWLDAASHGLSKNKLPWWPCPHALCGISFLLSVDPNWAQMLICALDLKMQPIHQAASDALLGPGNEDVNLSQDSTPDQGAGHPGMTEP